MSLALDASLSDVPGLPARIVKALAKEQVTQVAEIVWWLPFRHEDRRQMDGASFQPSEIPACYQVQVCKTGNKFFGRRRGAGLFEAQVEPIGGAIMGELLTLRWWNMSFMSRTIAEGQRLIVYGRVKENKGRLFMDHPEYEILNDEDEAAHIHSGRITPVYRLRAGITQKSVRTAAWYVLQALSEDFIPDVLPTPSTQGEFAGWSRARALRTVHMASSQEDLEKARRYLALEEFYGYQLRVVRRRRAVLDAGGHAHQAGSLAQEFEASLPFQMTGAQKRSLEEIQRDMASNAPMNRLLHGDVGSGKTVVAFAAMLGAVESGRQAALMAPTQILAEQHFNNARKWLEPLGLNVALRTGNRLEEGGVELWSTKKGSDRNHILIGTHALLHDENLVKNLGLVVIDEQHKFGVAQRARLIQKGNTPDVLVMTATPIPRTLTLTIYGDLDVSTLDERPKERGKIITKVRPASKQAEAAKFLLEQLEQGRQGYLVFPLIEESEKLEATAAKKGHEEWSKLLPHFQVGLLHGKLSAEEKDLVMRDFRSGKTDVLVSTTVIEVGVDVPNATVMFIHNAERFGLAQLHQLRGRIGRGEHTSYCVLFIKDKDEEAKSRLAIMEETTDGFRISEEDLKRRGPGDVLGRAQSGQAPLKFAELLANTRLVRLARQLAEKTLDEDPRLESPRLAEIRPFVFQEDAPQAMMQ
ncbi:ATP-dependent DNA helicase RecG [Prosthecobacter debontii]|uniref:ATP-dependent DNA helicase RecG n=1 Tax=Prosthecobacter debontii TaxID=48467 RepID=A0A1T4WQY5_9BACT|nr:ATP-dependent DNA helicase RecG [Prosthecobacter debontii]SKA79669.1 ATP-dependent DNA helicase RecG [Prosthecobacter debontii]